MGIALQYINIARDIAVDASISRVYLPLSWLKADNLTPADVISKPNLLEVARLRNRLLEVAFALYREAEPALGKLPAEARAPVRVAVESYMEIGRVVRRGRGRVREGRATVPVGRRVVVAWRALREG